ncbi:MAG TPA: HXXEE domain-containing protein [Pyrinomonadaceae bacterium]|jgi:hypothetical protein
MEQTTQSALPMEPPVKSEAAAIWSWLFPAAYLIHVTEEYLAGVALAPSATKIRGANMTASQFLIFNSIALMLMLAGLLLARRLRFLYWLLVSVGTVLFINGVFHIKGTIKIAAYNPGLISGALIFIPLGLLTLMRLKEHLSKRRYWEAVVVGILIYGIVLLVARMGRKLFEM